jgi:hypothetical protein
MVKTDEGQNSPGYERLNLTALCIALIIVLGIVTPVYFDIREPTDKGQNTHASVSTEARVKDIKPEHIYTDGPLRYEGESVIAPPTEQIDAIERIDEINDAQHESYEAYDDIYESPEFYIHLKAVDPRSAFLLTHYARMQSRLVTFDESREYLNSENYAFLSATIVVCGKCVLGYMFYEKYALSRQMTVDEYSQLGKSLEFASVIEAALSTDELESAYAEVMTF